MQVYNVEVFSPGFELRCHDNISELSYKEDYLSPVENVVTISMNDAVQKGDLIRLGNSEEDYFGVITSVKYGESSGNRMTIYYKPYTSLFDTEVLFDTDRQGSGSLESEIKTIISDNFIRNTDTLQNISSLGELSLLTSTTNWGLNLKSDTEGMHRCIVNFYSTFLVNGFQKYGIAVTAKPDYSKKKVNLSIGYVRKTPITIETGLPNVIRKSVVIRETSDDTNKLEVYNDANYTEKAVYYLHPDGNYNITDKDRITPVIRKVQAVNVEEGKTFSAAAASAAAALFGQIQYNNLVEIEVLRNDTLYPFQSYQFGQEVNVIHKGISYRSIYSGIELSSKAKLIFGAIRLDLTKIIKGGI